MHREVTRRKQSRGFESLLLPSIVQAWSLLLNRLRSKQKPTKRLVQVNKLLLGLNPIVRTLNGNRAREAAGLISGANNRTLKPSRMKVSKHPEFGIAVPLCSFALL